MRYLVLHDVNAIQKYIFATNRLREIRGASALIDFINRIVTNNLVQKHDGERIYLGGGGAAADFGSLDAAKEFCNEVSVYYASLTETASSTGVTVEYDENDSNSFQSQLQQGYREMRQKKAGANRKTQVLTGPYLKRCQSCGIYPVASYDDRFPELDERFICRSCLKKRDFGRRQSDAHRCTRWLFRSQHNTQFRFPKTIEDIGAISNPKGYIGVIYADGNRMGDWLQKIDRKKVLREFSRLIDKAARRNLLDSSKSR